MKDKIHFFYSKTKRRIEDKTGFSLCEWILLVVCFMGAMLMFLRCFFGTEFTDEAYYVSDALGMLHGNTLYSFDASMPSGANIIPAFFYYLYELFVPSDAGIFLYSRIVYTLLKFLVIICIYKNLENKYSRECRLFITALLIPFMGTSALIPDFSYNTISVWLMLLVSVLLYAALQQNGVKRCVTHFLCGVLTAFLVLAHPVGVVSVVAFSFLILINTSKKNRIMTILFYWCGGLMVLCTVLSIIVSKTSVSELVYGIETGIRYSPLTPDPLYSRIMATSQGFVQWGLALLIIAFVLLFFSGHIIEGDSILGRKDMHALALAITLIAGLMYTYQAYDKTSWSYGIGHSIFGLFASFIILSIFSRRVCRSALEWYIGLPLVCFVVLLSFTTVEMNSRFYYCVILIIPIIAFILETKVQLIKRLAVVGALALALFQGYTAFRYIYRDSRLRLLDTRVTEGVYAGLYTSQKRAKDVVELEHYLDRSISDEESVSFRDNAPVGYLMKNRNVCDIETWDFLQYSYGCNDPTGMYRYYKNRDAIPDVICYIDFGRDSLLSIENSSSDYFRFNDFVNQNYVLADDSFQNDTFRVLLYRNNGTFDYDFDSLIGK
ncbi:MAG: hypothetical protein J6Y57_02720 [Lachnospiraceae bacterium]|nr:hypothetical protein [Lachnospiraceae bacterium]